MAKMSSKPAVVMRAIDPPFLWRSAFVATVGRGGASVGVPGAKAYLNFNAGDKSRWASGIVSVRCGDSPLCLNDKSRIPALCFLRQPPRPWIQRLSMAGAAGLGQKVLAPRGT